MTGSNKIAYFDCYSGISGDMTLGALLDCGLELERLQKLLAGLELGFNLQVERVTSHGLTGSRAAVITDQAENKSRHLSDIERLLHNGSLPENVRDLSLAVFRNLARAEAAVHGIPVEKVHFHEVGAVDAIVDIAGCIGALYLLGVEEVYCSPLPVGRGMVKTAHGLLPLPAPATLELIKEHRVPIYGKETGFELVTPTGAALVCTLAKSFGPAPAFTLQCLGYGSGTIDPGYPNYLRVMLGTREPVRAASHEENVQLIEANIDDLNPEIFGYLMDKLLECGALDVYFSSIQMKKNRPAVKLSVLATTGELNRLINLVLTETSTLGVRVTEVRKIMHDRKIEAVETELGTVRVKYVPASTPIPLHFSPEYEDCLAVARRSGLPLKEVYRRVEQRFCALMKEKCGKMTDSAG